VWYRASSRDRSTLLRAFSSFDEKSFWVVINLIHKTREARAAEDARAGNDQPALTSILNLPRSEEKYQKSDRFKVPDGLSSSN
jgi:hypothetical protein